MDPYLNDSLIDKIVCEVKSQGAFDQFRRECIADVDTKPAYQNLRQRVENSVASFLNGQKWKADLNKNHLRDRLRRNITESGFLETGVERIVDQVVNPKINSVFLPTIEDIFYKYLGIEKPKHSIPEHPPPLPPLPPQPNMFSMVEPKAGSNGVAVDFDGNFLPNDLEAVSPDSDRSMANKSRNSNHKSDDGENNLNNSMESDHTDILNDSAEKSLTEEFESPAFELIEGARASSSMSMVDDGDGDNSKLSAISGLTSQDSVQSGLGEEPMEEKSFDAHGFSSIPPPPPPPPLPPPEAENGHSLPDALKDDDMEIDDPPNHDQNSILSQVSSNSRLSIVTSDSKSLTVPGDHCEEAQMPKFNENSSNSHNANTGNVTAVPLDPTKERKPLLTSFDIKQDEITFEGTRRHSICLDIKAESAGSIKSEHLLDLAPLPMYCPPRPPSPLGGIPMPSSEPPQPPPPPNQYSDIMSDDLIKTESMSSTSLIISETKSLNLNDQDDENNTIPAVDAFTPQQEFKFEEPAGGGDSRDKTNDSTHKSRKRDRSHNSSSSSTRDKDRHSSSDKDRDRKHSSSSRNSSSSSKEHRSSSSRRDDKSGSTVKTSSSSRTSSSSKHHSSSSRHNSSSSSKNRSRHESSSSKSSSSNSNHTNKRSSTSSSTGHDRSDKSDEKSAHRKSGDSSKSTKKRENELSNGDDHFSQKIERRRSTDRDSNDDGNQQQPKPRSAEQCASTPQASGVAQESTSNSNGSSNLSTQDQTDSIRDNEHASTTHEQLHQSAGPSSDFVLPTLPVVVDDILTGSEEINLELLITQQTTDPVLSSIQQTLTGSGLKKPKLASNIHEARKLMRVRKQMDRDEKKRMEQALVLAKQYINNNSEVADSLGMSNNQGVELEFACITSGNSAAPSISSPLKVPKAKPTNPINVLQSPQLPKCIDDTEDFLGFEDSVSSKTTAEQFVEDTRPHFAKWAQSCRNHSDYSRSIHLYRADPKVAQIFVNMFSGDVWRYSKNAKREAIILRPTTVEPLVSRDARDSPTRLDAVMPPTHRGNAKKDDTIQTIRASRKRKSTSSSSDTNIGSRSRNVRSIKVAATIQMAAVESEDCFVEEDDDDRAVAGSVPMPAQVSPTPSDHSVSSKENNFVPKIKKAVSRSIAHNNTLNANLACVVAPICAEDKHQSINKATTSSGGSSSSKANQRYSSDDLYKPRPILLGSRSRRRVFDANDM